MFVFSAKVSLTQMFVISLYLGWGRDAGISRTFPSSVELTALTFLKIYTF